MQVIDETIRDDPPTDERVSQVYQYQKASRDSKQIINSLSHHPSLHHYLHPLDSTQEPICPSCRLDEQDLNHWFFECPAGDAIRQQVFGNHKGSLEWLVTQPGDVVAYARNTLVNLDV